MLKLVAVFIGGGLGSVARFGISEMVKAFGGSNFPLATLISNFLSCLVLALTIYFSQEKLQSQPYLALLLIVGFCGGFSTFSSFSFETIGLIKSGQIMLAAANVLINTLVCLGLVYLVLKNR